jgi:1,4-dihydroxy-6-naphthoate synthase
MSTQEITIYHSPDADDAFMFYGLVSGAVSYPGFTFHHDLADIESLNQKALRGELDVTAVSVHAFSKLHEHYSILSAGASMGGENYGPRLIAKSAINLNDGVHRRLAIPGPMTSANLALSLYLHQHGIEAELVPVHFDQVFAAVASGEVDAGVVIHEGQLTLEREGFALVLDLGKWWWEKHQLPLPLGINVVKRSLGAEALKAIGVVLKGSIVYSLEHRAQALDYALSYGRGLSRADADTFVGMYVNEYTVDLTDKGRKSIALFLEEGFLAGIISERPRVEFVTIQ